jgi:hypothetical protein
MTPRKAPPTRPAAAKNPFRRSRLVDRREHHAGHEAGAHDPSHASVPWEACPPETPCLPAYPANVETSRNGIPLPPRGQKTVRVRLVLHRLRNVHPAVRDADTPDSLRRRHARRRRHQPRSPATLAPTDVPRETTLATPYVPATSVRRACARGSLRARLVAVHSERLRSRRASAMSGLNSSQTDEARAQRKCRRRRARIAIGPPDPSQSGDWRLESGDQERRAVGERAEPPTWP